MNEINRSRAERRAIYVAIIDLIDSVVDTDGDIAGRVIRASTRNLYLDLITEIDRALDNK